MLTLNEARERDLAQVKELYEASFPAAERKTFSHILRLRRKGICEVLTVISDGFRGLAIVLKHADLALLDYFAVLPGKRGQGIGTGALSLLRKRYAKKRLFLEIESPDESAPNADQRLRRKAFYLRNGFVDSGLRVTVFGVDMDLLSDGSPLSFEDYLALYQGALGRTTARLLRIRRRA